MKGHWVTHGSGEEVLIFAHGFLSSGETCWKNSNGAYWPDLIASDPKLSHVGVYVFTYKTGPFSGSFRIGNVVDSLKEHLAMDDVLSRRVIAFVCHSMGGLVVRKFLVERAVYLASANHEVKLFLVASPSLGSSYANWLEPIARFLGHKQADAMRFKQDNAWLMDLDKEFLNLLSSRRLNLSGKELIEDKFLIGSPFVKTQIVEPFAGARYFPDPYKVPDSDHFSIAKPKDCDAEVYRLLRSFLLKRSPGPSPEAVGSPRPDSVSEGEVAVSIAVLQKAIERIAVDRGVPTAPLQAVLAKLGQSSVRDEEIVGHLETAASELLDLRNRFGKLQSEQPELAKARAEAMAFVDLGQFDEARVSLQKNRQSSRRMHQRLAREEAELLADEARIDKLQLDHRSAADKFQSAADLVAKVDAGAEMQFLTEQAVSLKDHGQLVGDRSSVREAILIYRKCLDRLGAADEIERAGVLSNIGTALLTVGETEDSNEDLNEAERLLEEALHHLSYETKPEFWAVTQNSFGLVQLRLGDRNQQPERYERAIFAIRESLTVWTGENDTHNRAMALSNLGSAFQSLGEAKKQVGLLEEAVEAHRLALQFRERDPVNWAGSQNNLGNVLSTLGRVQDRNDLFQEAITSYRDGLKALSRERTPMPWATLRNNLGITLAELGQKIDEPRLVEEAVSAMNEGLLVGRLRIAGRTASQEKLANALMYLGSKDFEAKRFDNAVERYEKVIATFDNVLEGWTVEQNREKHFHALGEQARALWIVGELRRDVALLERSVSQSRAAIDEYLNIEGHESCKDRWQRTFSLAEASIKSARCEGGSPASR